jgi:hypothetical protein
MIRQDEQMPCTQKGSTEGDGDCQGEIRTQQLLFLGVPLCSWGSRDNKSQYIVFSVFRFDVSNSAMMVDN